MIDETYNPIVLRYDATGHLINRLLFLTIMKLPCITVDESYVLRTLNAGHHVILNDGSWIELENRHC